MVEARPATLVLLGRVERRVTPAPPHGTRRADFPHRALRTSSPRRVESSETTGTWEWASVCPPCAARRSADPSAPSLHGHYPASSVVWADPTSPHRCPPLWLPLGSGSTGAPRGGGRISRVPCASRPCVPTAEAPVDAGALLPWRAPAAAFPAVAYGSASTVKGISGLVPFSPATGGFRPTGFLSTLRPGRYRTGRKTRSQRPDGSSSRRWDFLRPVWP
jgi:hypothetical protein